MEYDEIDQYVNEYFNRKLSVEERVEMVDRSTQEVYDDAKDWHKNRIAEGTNPRSGLRGLDYIEWNENGVDGAAASPGAVGGAVACSNGGRRQRAVQTKPDDGQAEKRGLTCGEFILICVVVLGLMGFMALWAR